MTDPVPDEHPVLLFDGVCNLCNASVQYVIEHDDEGIFHFAPLQSAAGAELLQQCGLSADHMDSIVLVDGDDCYTKSDAALRVARRLGLPQSGLAPALFVPKWLRDRAYDLVAEHRYLVFGRRESCMVPSADVRERFLAMDDVEAE
ncbi:thiol-disulfide oxidoreductase DCC family protein [Haloarculaceae archaeon H-GB2-1]|nr:thiol-disulfide oxidoreductase DCC family protein [Haloarculaceae archaeon H-GB1-1]MEA5386975.1 thiol-disulfide oxidoreductase DCC family protein [Haloarculaceae archaeon H-GB11]MEA5408477.1 thiol-disulfide oxidoreductase DCC family protein [Haloarculaceae archaeon H-GB2-1]